MDCIRIFLPALAFTFFLTSCRESNSELLSYRNDNDFEKASLSFSSQFDAFWTAMNCNYSIWDVESEYGINWDDVYYIYSKKFHEIDRRRTELGESITNQELENLYMEILCPLHDGHLDVYIKNLDTQEFFEISPAWIRREKREKYVTLPRSSDYENYGIVEYIEDSSMSFFMFCHFEDNILYLRLHDFTFSDNNYTIENPLIKKLWERWFDLVQRMHKEKMLKGIIVDIRNNSGGDTANYQYALGALQPPCDSVYMEKTGNYVKYREIGWKRLKTGVGRLDYSELIPLNVECYHKPYEYITQEPIVVLANGSTMSMAETICLGTKQMDNAVIIGTNTYGALGIVMEEKTSYAGSFGAGGWSLSTPFAASLASAAFFSNDMKTLESIGIAPDIEQTFDIELYERTGRDSQLERALDYIRNSK